MSNDQLTKIDIYICGIVLIIIFSGGIVLCAYGVRDYYSTKEYNNLYQKTDAYVINFNYYEMEGREQIQAYGSDHCCRYYKYYLMIKNYTYNVNNTIYFGEYRYTTNSFNDVQESIQNLGKEYITIYYLISDPKIVIYKLMGYFNTYFLGMVICYGIFLFGLLCFLLNYLAEFCSPKSNEVHPQRSIIHPDISVF